MRPKVLGALLDGLVESLRNDQVEIDELPRMADFAEFGIKFETAYWPSGTFSRAYAANRRETGVAMLDSDTMTTVLRRWWSDLREGRWEGTASELLVVLGSAATEVERRAPGWPRDPRTLGRGLRRSMPLLREQGIELELDRWAHGHRKIILSRSNSPELPVVNGCDPLPTSPIAEIPSVGVEEDPGAYSEDDYLR
jgi:hypothetical protein